MLVLTIGLFIAISALFIALLLPGEYSPSPVFVLTDSIKMKMVGYLTRGDREKLYTVLGKTAGDTMKAGFFAGAGLALLTLIVLLHPVGILALLPAGVAFFIGLMLADLVFKNEFRRWQARLIDGIPALVSFVPSFLETGAITPREALYLTVPFLPEPLRSELHRLVDNAARTGRIKEALSGFAERAQHPVVDAICFRLSAAWDVKVSPDIFADLADQIKDMSELAAARATAVKGGLLALVCVIGFAGAMLVFGYPAAQSLFKTLGGVFM